MDVMSLVARISLDDSEYKAGLKGLSGTVKGVAKVGAAAWAAATTAVTGFAAASIKTGMAFDKSMSEVYATLGSKAEEVIQTGEYAGQKSADALRAFAQEMGRTTQYTASQSAEALNYMALAGYDAVQSMDMLPNVMNLAAAGSFELGRASDMLTDTQTALGLSFERTNQMVDEWAKAASTGNTSVEQLGDAFLTVGGLARELNGGLVTLADGTKAPVDGVQELEIALTAMANAGVKGTEAGTHMRNMLLKLASPTSEGVKQLDALGVSVFDNEGKMRSLHDVFGDLNGALGELTQEEKIQAISDLFNTRDLASAEALLNAVNEDWDAIGESILDANGAAGEMAQTKMDNLAGDIEYFKSALEGAKIALSDGMSPALRKFVQAGTEGVSEFTEKIKEGDYAGAAQTIGETLGQELRMALSNLPSLVEAGASLVKGLIQGVTGGGEGLSSMFTNLVSSIDANLPTLIDKAMTIGVEFSGKLREGFGQLVSGGLEIIQHIAQGIATAMPSLISNIPTIVSNIAGLINDNAPKLLATGINIIVTLGKGLIQAIPTLIANIPKILQAIWDVFMAFNWLALGGQVVNLIKSGITALGKSLPTALKGLGTKALNGFKSIPWGNVGSFVIRTIVKGIQALISLPGTILKKAGSLAMKAFTSISWGNVGTNIIKGIARGITAAAGFIVNAAKSAARSALNAAKSALGIKSPSKVFEEQVGKNIDLGMAEGIKKNMPYVDDALANIQPNAISTSWTPSFNGANQGLGGVINIYLNYDASSDANEMVKDIARGVRRYRMAGVV